MVMVIIGIVGSIVAVFIQAPVRGYTDSVERAAAVDEADLALRRIARDLRLALPNSVRVSPNGTSIEILLTSTGGRYLAIEDDVPDQPALDFDDPANTSFAVLGGTMQPIQPGNFIVIHNLGEGNVPADAYRLAGGADMNIARVAAVNLDNPAMPRVTLVDNAFARQSVTMPSPGRRFQVVTMPVTYRCAVLADGSLGVTRLWGYTITPVHSPTPTSSSREALIASRVDTCNGMFQYGSDATRRSALVILNLSLRVHNGTANDTVRLVHQVHVDNTP